MVGTVHKGKLISIRGGYSPGSTSANEKRRKTLRHRLLGLFIEAVKVAQSKSEEAAISYVNERLGLVLMAHSPRGVDVTEWIEECFGLRYRPMAVVLSRSRDWDRKGLNKRTIEIARQTPLPEAQK